MSRTSNDTDLDWSDPSTIPTMAYTRGPKDRGDGQPDPRYIQSNLYTLAKIGGAYEMLAMYVERAHLGVLTPWRLDSQAPSVIEYIEYNNRPSRREER